MWFFLTHTLGGWGEPKDTKNDHSKPHSVDTLQTHTRHPFSSHNMKPHQSLDKQNTPGAEIFEKVRIGNSFSHHFDAGLSSLDVANSVPLARVPSPVLFPPSTGHDVSSSADPLTIGPVCEGSVTLGFSCDWCEQTQFHLPVRVCVCVCVSLSHVRQCWSLGRTTISSHMWGICEV